MSKIRMEQRIVWWHVVRCVTLCGIFFLLHPHVGFAQDYAYERVRNTSQLVAGSKYIITNAGGNWGVGYQKSNNRAAVSVSAYKDGNFLRGDIPVATSKGDAQAVYEFTLGGESDAWTFYDEVYKGFLYAADGKDDKYNLLRTAKNELYCSFSITQGLTITFAPKNNAVVRKYLRFNNEVYPSLFSCYRDCGYEALSLYRKVRVLGSMSISQHGYTTFTSQDVNYEMPQGCVGYTVTYKDGMIVLNERYKEGDAIAKGTPLLIQGDPGNYTIYESTRTPRPADENLLHGEFDEDGKITYDIEHKEVHEYYKLTTKGGANFGFYWGADGGAPFRMSRTDRAYLVLPSNSQQEGQVKGLVLDEAQVETGVASPAKWPADASKTYDLSGRVCPWPLAPGIYIRAGRKFQVGK